MLEAITNGEIAGVNLTSDNDNINARFGYVVYKVRSSILLVSDEYLAKLKSILGTQAAVGRCRALSQRLILYAHPAREPGRDRVKTVGR